MVFLSWGFEGWVKKAQEIDVSQELELSICKSGIQTVLIFIWSLNIYLKVKYQFELFMLASHVETICCTEVSIK